MGRLINADVLKDEIEEWLDSVGDVVIGKSLSYYAELEGCIDECPTVDAEPVRHGKWIFNTDEFTPKNRCSCCGYNKPIEVGEYEVSEPDNYCPNCGARMIEKE